MNEHFDVCEHHLQGASIQLHILHNTSDVLCAPVGCPWKVLIVSQI